MNAMVTDLDFVPWTRLSRDAVFLNAQTALERKARIRPYHEWSRVRRHYQAAAVTLRLPYDRALDLAILCKDVHYGPGQDAAEPSINWLADHLPMGREDPDFDATCVLLKSIKPMCFPEDPRLALVELSDFLDPEQALLSLELIRREAKSLHGVSGECFSLSFADFLQGLCHRLRSGLPGMSVEYKEHGSMICKNLSSLYVHLEDSRT